MKRLYNLDYLRGVAAFGIMIYHYLTWTLGEFSSDNFMGRIGIYGVSVFYCLSGLTLFNVYYENFTFSLPALKSFVKKRILRIFPLLWIATLLTVVVTAQKPGFILLFLNLSGLFGFVKWNAYLATGAWSIGNELVFYLFFPFFVFLAKSYKAFFVILCLMILGVYCYFAFSILTPAKDIIQQWRNYVNPLNQLFLFLAGFLLGLIFRKRLFNNYFGLGIIILAFILFVYYPVAGDTINLITGITRLVFTVISVAICLGFYKMSFQLPKLIHVPLKVLGEASYSVYLLHPIIYFILMPWFKHLFVDSQFAGLVLSVILTLVLSYLVYEFIEKYFIRIARK